MQLILAQDMTTHALYLKMALRNAGGAMFMEHWETARKQTATGQLPPA